MTIGTSLGAFYEDEYHYQAREFLKKNRPNENREIDPKDDRTKSDPNIIDPGTKTDDFITQVSDTDVPIVPSPDLVPEQSPNLNILKSFKDLPPTPMPGTNYESHPYWKNR